MMKRRKLLVIRRMMAMSYNDKDPKEKSNNSVDEKTEIAQFIAEKSKKFSSRTASLANAGERILRWLSDWFDRILFNPRHSKLIAFGVALMLYLGFSGAQSASPLVNSSKEASSVNVNVSYNAEMYEISGVEKTVKVTFIGSPSDISLLSLDSSTIKAELDLTGLSEGKHQVNYRVDGISSRIQTIVEPASANVTIKTKIAEKRTVDYDYINQDKMAPEFVLAEPELDIREVSIKASEETLSKVAYVKALIDVSGQTKDFEVDAKVVAYDQDGNKLDQVDVIPATVKAKVGVSKPSKTVAIKPLFDGAFPEGKTISDFKMDNESIMIYGPLSVLDQIDEIRVPISTSLLTGDTTKLQQNITLPTGVKSGSVSKVNIEVSLGDVASKVVENVVITYRNNNAGYKMSVPNKDDAVTSVTIYGTQEKLNSFADDKLQVYFDLRDAVEGENQEFKLYVVYNDASAPYYQLVPEKEAILIDLIK